MLLEKVYALTGNSGAQYSSGGSVDTQLSTVEGFENLGDLFGFITNLIIGVGWALVFVMLALGFVQYVLSRGEKTAVDAAQKWLTYAVIGGVGLFFIGFLKGVIPTLIGGGAEGVVDTGGGIVDF